MCLEKRTSAASRQVRRLFTARLNPCPSFDSLFPSLFGSVKASCAVQIGQRKNLIGTGLKFRRPFGTGPRDCSMSRSGLSQGEFPPDEKSHRRGNSEDQQEDRELVGYGVARLGYSKPEIQGGSDEPCREKIECGS